MRLTLLTVVLLAGCCPKPQRTLPTKIVVREGPCKLPGKLLLPSVVFVPCAGSKAIVCLDINAAKALARREALMKGWIQDARARCSGTR